jgi:hypothetical protein
MVLHARMKAGSMVLEHWTQQAHKGGRIVGDRVELTSIRLLCWLQPLLRSPLPFAA